MKLPVVGDVFEGRFAIEKTLGQGGQATVYRARDVEAGGVVALKVLRPGADGSYDPNGLGRYRRELHLVAQLRDEHTVRLLAHGESSSGLVYLVFEYVDGRDLASVLEEQGTLPEAVVVHVLAQVLRSLGEAHRKNLLHRDIKPENVLIYTAAADPWAAKVLDFGIARPIEGPAGGLTRTGELVGTPRYMSPEQLRSHDLTPASDIYTAGLLALEMLFGRSFLGGGSLLQQIERLHSGHLIAPAHGASPALLDVLRRMTVTRVEQRYQRADDVLAALGLQSSALVDVAAPERGVPLAALALLSLCLIGIGVAGLYLMWTTNEEPEPPAVSATRTNPFEDTTTTRVELAPATDMAVVTPDLGPPLSTGCGAPPPFSLVGDFQDAPHSPRSWVGFLPARHGPNTPLPLIVLFHRSDQSALEFLTHTNFMNMPPGALRVLEDPPSDPERGNREVAIVSIWDKVTNAKAWTNPERIVSQFDAALEQVGRTVCIDWTRVYAVGWGAGGRAIEVLRCRRRLTATATVAHLPESRASMCTSREVPPHIYIDLASKCTPPLCDIWAHLERDEWLDLAIATHECDGASRVEPRRAGECTHYDCARSALTWCVPSDSGTSWDAGILAHDDGVPTEFEVRDTIWEFFLAQPPRDTRL